MDEKNIDQLPDEYLREIGRVVTRWNRLELLINMVLIKLLGKSLQETRSHVVFAHMAFPQKLDAMSALITELRPPPQSPLLRYKEEVQPRLKRAQEERNKIVHSNWTIADGVVQIYSVSARGTFKFRNQAISVKEIEASSDAILKAGQALGFFVLNAL